MGKWMVYYLAVVNVVAFIVYGIDKLLAKMQKWRIPEKVLLGLAALGGTVGAFFGMQTFRHKTRKAKFFVGIPLIFLFQCALVIYLNFFV